MKTEEAIFVKYRELMQSADGHNHDSIRALTLGWVLANTMTPSDMIDFETLWRIEGRLCRKYLHAKRPDTRKIGGKW